MAHPTATTEAHVALPEESSGQQYVLLPSWVLVPQVFLALGWLRAAIGHAIRPEWWSGQDIRDFIANQSGDAILGYNFFLEDAILSMPSVTAGVVFALQFIIGVALFFNWRPVMALSLGGFLNVNFMLAGVVNPSIFYLVLAAAIAAWRMDERWSAEFKATVARRFLPVALLLSVLLLTGVQSVHPGTVTEDPAAVLIFFLLILVAVTWSLHEYDRPFGDGPSVLEGRGQEALDPVVSDDDDQAVADVEPVDSDDGDPDSAGLDDVESESVVPDDANTEPVASDDANSDSSESDSSESDSSESDAADTEATDSDDSDPESSEHDDPEGADDSASGTPASDATDSDDLDSPDTEDSASPDEAFALVDKP